jgi:hypothetical protein
VLTISFKESEAPDHAWRAKMGRKVPKAPENHVKKGRNPHPHSELALQIGDFEDSPVKLRNDETVRRTRKLP